MSSQIDMEKEIVAAEVFLKGLKAEGGFSVPEGYFDKLKVSLDFIEEEDLIKEKMGAIARTEVPGGFSFPQRYLEELEGRVMSSVLDVGNEAKTVKFFPYRSFWLVGIAATFMISAFLFLWKDEKSTLIVASNKIEIDQVAAHLEVGDLNEDLLCDAGWCDELSTLPSMEIDITDEYMNATETDLLIEEL